MSVGWNCFRGDDQPGDPPVLSGEVRPVLFGPLEKLRAGFVNAANHSHNVEDHHARLPVLHLDITPEHLIIAPDGGASLIGFGSARDLVREPEERGERSALPWAPPEQRQDRPSRATDIYLVGAMALQALARRSPDELLRPPARPALEGHINVSPRFRAFLERLLEPAEQDRPQSAREALALLDAQPREKPRRIWALGLAALGVAALLVTGGVALLAKRPAARQQPAPTRVRPAVKAPRAPAAALNGDPLELASFGGKYSKLLRTLEVPQDASAYGQLYDFGWWNGTSWRGHVQLPPGYWVYVAPRWYIWGGRLQTPEAKSRPQAPQPPAPRRNWGPEQAAGAPDTPRAGDIVTAWASRTPDGQAEWLRLTYETPIEVLEVHVYETFNPGAVNRVTAGGEGLEEVVLWEGTDPTPPGSGMGVSRLPVAHPLRVKHVTVHLDSQKVKGWNEIDAVGLLDPAGRLHFALSAEASSTYAESWPTGVAAGRRSWGPEQATGAPDTHQAGDITTAWASKTPDAQREWLRLTYEDPVEVHEVHVYQTYNPGAVYQVTAEVGPGEEVVLWEGSDPTPAGSGMGNSKIRVERPVTARRITVHVDSPRVRGWNEIDAVGVVDKAGRTHWAVSAEASSTFAE